MENKEMWIVGKNTNYETKAWEFQGLYDNQEDAYNRCENEDWWFALVRVNEHIPTEPSEFEEFHYPIQ